MSIPDEVAWSCTLDEMECHLAVVEVALQGKADFPGSFAAPVPSVALPNSLRHRARLLLERQRDVELILRERVEALGRYIFGTEEGTEPVGVSVDIRS